MIEKLTKIKPAGLYFISGVFLVIGRMLKDSSEIYYYSFFSIGLIILIIGIIKYFKN